MDNNSKKLKRIQYLFGTLENERKRKIASLESMEKPINDIILRFPNVAKQIFNKLDDESLTNCRMTNLLWLGTLENMDIIWVRILNKHSKLLKKSERSEEKYKNSIFFLRSRRLKYHQKVFEKISIIEEILRKSHEKNPNIMGKMSPLHVAAIQGNEYFTNLLLNKIGILDVNPRDLSQWTPFIWATNVSDEKIPYGDFGYSPLTLTSKRAYLSSKNRDLYELMKDFYVTPLHGIHFIRDKEKASLSVCKMMIDCNVDIETKTNCEETALHRAAFQGNYHICRLIIEHANNINPQNHNNLTPFHLAVIHGHVKVCELFIGSNVDTAAVTKNNRTALHLAAFHGHLEICKLLIDRVKDKNPVTDIGMFTPFHYAARKGHLSLVKLLIEMYVDVDMKTIRGRTALHLAADNGHFEVCQAIIEVVEEINPQDNDGFTPIDLSRKEEITNLILSHAYEKQYKWTTLHMAANCGNLEDCQEIIQHLEDKNPIESNGLTPMHLAAMNGHVWVYKWLSRNIEDKNPKDFFGQTPLHFAAENGDYLFCQLILNVSDDKNPEDDFGLTPLKVAFKKARLSAKHKAVCELIKESILVYKNMRSQADLSYQMLSK